MSDAIRGSRDRAEALRALISVTENYETFLSIVRRCSSREESIKEISREFTIQPQFARLALASSIELLFAPYRASHLRDELADLTEAASREPDSQ